MTKKSIASLLSVIGLLLVFMPYFSAAAADPNPPSIRGGGAWPIRRQWTPAETRHYAKWVENLFDVKTKGTVEQRTAKLERMLTDPEMNLLQQPDFLGSGSNPQLPASIMRSMHHLMDCAKFTAFIPAYYAYRRALPWITATVYSGERGVDVRISAFNYPTRGANSAAYSSLASFFQAAVGHFISGNYRVNLNSKDAGLSDTVPVALDPQYLMPGCMNYLDGHCLVLAKVTEYGELYFLNCSTTNTRDIFTYNGMNAVGGITPRGSDPDNEWMGCFQGLRVLRYPIAETNSQGVVTRVRRRTNEEMREFGYSTEQYDIVQQLYTAHALEEDGMKPQSLHDLIRLRMKRVEQIAPASFIADYCDEILSAYLEREWFVQDAWNDVKKNGHIVYPEDLENENIFQALGRWETWSSPSSDVDRRNKYFYLADWMEYAVRMFGMQPNFIDLTGLESYNINSQADLAAAMITEKNRWFQTKSLDYTHSSGKIYTLTLADIEERLYDLSFDPNHPPELRWGAPEGSEERENMPQSYTPLPKGAKMAMDEAYKLQYFYRTLCQRETSSSYLRGMYTEGFPIRDKLDAQVSKWSYLTEPLLYKEEPEPVEIIVPVEAEKPPSLTPPEVVTQPQAGERPTGRRDPRARMGGRSLR
ncbi:MAG: hypothetical protein WCX86_06700 [Candidatus Hydrogenedentales bacterium]